MLGGLMRPGANLAMSEAELAALPGFSRDVGAARTEAKRLLAEAGIARYGREAVGARHPGSALRRRRPARRELEGNRRRDDSRPAQHLGLAEGGRRPGLRHSAGFFRRFLRRPNLPADQICLA